MATFDRMAAKKAGYTDTQIDSYLQQKSLPERQQQIGSQNTVQAPEQGVVSKLLGILMPGIVNIARDVGEASRVQTQVLPQQQQQLANAEKAGQLAKQAVLETDPAKKKALLDQSRTISGQAKDFQTNFSPDIERGYLSREFQAGVEGGLLATPFLGKMRAVGKGVQAIASKSPILQTALTSGLKSGAVGGALLGGSQEGDVGQRLTGALTGGVTGGVIGGSFDVAGKAYSGVKNLLSKIVSSKASQAFTKTTPAAFSKIVSQHGKDINKIAQKYVPAGAGYDEMIGGVAQRGNGGIIKDLLDQAEKPIIDTIWASGSNFRINPDQLLKTLAAQKKLIAAELGGGARVKALNALIEQIKNKYKNGVTAKQALTTLRYANQKFGENIVKTKAADAMANAAQKLEANTLRAVLKKIFPDIADALDTQSELLTLKPVLNKARATASTQGSKIRVGRSLLDIFDFPFQKPELASQLMQPGQPGVVPQQGGKALLSVLGVGPFTRREKAGELPATQEPATAASISQQGADGMVITPQQMQQVELSPDISEKTKTNLRKTYEIQQKQTKPLSSVAAEKVAKADRGLRALASLEKGWSQEKTILAKIPGAPGAQMYRRDQGDIIDIIGYLSTGAAIDKNQRKDYEYFLPTPLDSKEIVKQKIDAIRQMFTDYKIGQQATSGSFDFQQLTQ